MADEEDDFADSADEDYLELDSPLEPTAEKDPVEEEDFEMEDGFPFELPPSSSPSKPKRPRSRQPKQPREDRTKQMDWANALPYQCETLEEFDATLEFVEQRLIECVKTRE